jgi:hypothetical protein
VSATLRIRGLVYSIQLPASAPFDMAAARSGTGASGTCASAWARRASAGARATRPPPRTGTSSHPTVVVHREGLAGTPTTSWAAPPAYGDPRHAPVVLQPDPLRPSVLDQFPVERAGVSVQRVPLGVDAAGHAYDSNPISNPEPPTRGEVAPDLRQRHGPSEAAGFLPGGLRGSRRSADRAPRPGALRG